MSSVAHARRLYISWFPKYRLSLELCYRSLVYA